MDTFWLVVGDSGYLIIKEAKIRQSTPIKGIRNAKLNIIVLSVLHDGYVEICTTFLNAIAHLVGYWLITYNYLVKLHLNFRQRQTNSAIICARKLSAFSNNLWSSYSEHLPIDVVSEGLDSNCLTFSSLTSDDTHI